MSSKYLGDEFDIHCGGYDLIFPHHENEIAQSQAATGKGFAGVWLHAGYLNISGTKMSKSLGNITNLLDLTDRYDPRAYRLLVLRSHYRSPIEVNETTITDASRQLDRLDAFARRTAAVVGTAEPQPAAIARFRELMDADLNTPGVMDLISRLVRDANSAFDIEDEAAAAPLAAAVTEICGAVGLELHAEEDEGPSPEVWALVERRAEAKKAKDFAVADQIRDDLRARGWLVEDTAKGPTLRRG